MNLANVSTTVVDLIVSACGVNDLKQECRDNNWKRLLIRTGTIAICIVGIVANISCIYLFRRLKTFKNSSYIFYLKFLSLSDTLCLFMELLRPLNYYLAEQTANNQQVDSSDDDAFLDQYLDQPNGSSHLMSNLNNLNCKLVEFLTASFHLSSAWLICAFSIERCIAVYWPLLIRQLFNITRTKYICWFIFTIAPSIQVVRLFFVQSSCSDNSDDFFPINHTLKCSAAVKKRKCTNGGRFLGEYNAYFHQLACLVLIPTLVVITCNSMVFYRIIQRRRMINSGKFLVTFKINRNSQKQSEQQQQPSQQHQPSVPMIKVTLCGAGDPEITISNSLKSRIGRSHSTGRLSSFNRHLGSIKLSEFKKSINSKTTTKASETATMTVTPPLPPSDRESFSNSGLMTVDDEFASYSTTYDETTRSVDYPPLKSLHHSPSISSSIFGGGGGGNNGGPTSAKQKRNRLNKRNRDIKLALLMIFSGAFLVFVLPDTVLNIYKYHYYQHRRDIAIDNGDDYSILINSSSSSLSMTTTTATATSNINISNAAADLCRLYTFNSRLNLFLDLFHMLKLLYFSSNFLAYLTLTTFSHVPKRVKKQIK